MNINLTKKIFSFVLENKDHWHKGDFHKKDKHNFIGFCELFLLERPVTENADYFKYHPHFNLYCQELNAQAYRLQWFKVTKTQIKHLIEELTDEVLLNSHLPYKFFSDVITKNLLDLTEEDYAVLGKPYPTFSEMRLTIGRYLNKKEKETND